MRRVLFAIFVVVPLIEIGLFILIGQAIGLLPTLLGILVTAVVGAVIVRAQGLALLREIQRALGRGQLPGRALADAMMVGIAGVLMLTPGYFTDLCGLLLLIPPVRGFIYRELARPFVVVPGGGAASPATRRPDVIDLDEENWRPR